MREDLQGLRASDSLLFFGPSIRFSEFHERKVVHRFKRMTQADIISAQDDNRSDGQPGMDKKKADLISNRTVNTAPNFERHCRPKEFRP